MTKEEAKLVLDNARPQTKEIDRQFYDDEDLNNALDMAIKALEQDGTDMNAGTIDSDCISRQAAIDMAKSYNTDGYDSYTPLVVDVEDIEELPPVTPTHGTCKDCHSAVKNYGNGRIYCLFSNCIYDEDFWCKKFEKRGNEE